MRRVMKVASVAVVVLLAGAGVGYYAWREAEMREAVRPRTSGGSLPLVLKVYVEKAAVRVGDEESVVHAELHNVSDKYQCIFTPGFEAREGFVQYPKPDLKDGIKCDWPVWPLGIRLASASRGQEFVALAPGGYYGVTFRETVATTGLLTWSIKYSNSQEGDRQDLPAWMGTIGPVESGGVRVNGT